MAENVNTADYPLISLVTIAYNASRYIESTAQSIAAQTYPNIECILIDGASTDDTIERYRAILGEKAIVYSEKDDGIYDAMNRGAQRASGDYILYMHADDEFVSSDSLMKLYSALSASDKQWVSAFYLTRNSRNEVIKKDRLEPFTFSDMLRADQIRHQTALVPTAWVREFPFRKQFKFAMDYDHFLRLWDKYGPPEILLDYIAYFRWDGTNLSSHFEQSLRDEWRVKMDFRRGRGQRLGMIHDTVIYLLRLLKIKLYYNIVYDRKRKS